MTTADPGRPSRPRGTILALGGGGFSAGDSPLLDDLLLDLARPRAETHGRGDRPRVAFVGTASGDAEDYCAKFTAAFADRAETTVVSLFWRDGSDLAATLRGQDAVFVGGGSTLNLLALWRLHGLDVAMAGALADGVVLCGVSAGMNCWFDASVTDSFGPLSALTDGLGFLPGSACPHYDGEAARRPAYLDLVGSRALPSGFAAEDGVGLLFRDGQLFEAVSERPDGQAFRVHLSGGALDVDDAADLVDVAESPVDVRYLG